MKWNRFTIKTKTDAEDMIICTLAEIGSTLLTEIRLRVQFCIHDVVVDVLDNLYCRFDIIAQIRSFNV